MLPWWEGSPAVFTRTEDQKINFCDDSSSFKFFSEQSPDGYGPLEKAQCVMSWEAAHHHFASPM